MITKHYFSALLLSSLLALSCNNKVKTEKKEIKQTTETPKKNFKNKGHELVYNLVQTVGNYKTLRAKKDVIYTYTYQTPDGKKDVSTEKYIFDGELSYGKYQPHERTLPDLKGVLEQGYDGKNYWLKHEGKAINDETALKRVAFNRPTNFYWFTMFQKLLDPGLIYDYLGDTVINETNYQIVKISFETKNDKPTDIYQLYINKDTNLVDQFLFTVADFGVMETPFLMTLEYEKIDDLLIPTTRKYKKSTWDAAVSQDPWILVNWSNIKFNNGLTTKQFNM